MLTETGALICAGLTIALLLASGIWTNHAFRRFEEIPAHYDFRGNVTRLTSRKIGAWLVPIAFSMLLVGIVISFGVVPPRTQNGDPILGIVLSCVSLLAAQGFILFLHMRWARAQ